VNEDAGRPSHLIAPDEVAAWLADSAVQQVTFHNTTPGAAAEIRSRGVRIEASWVGSYGQGFYTTSVEDPFYGEVALSIAVRLLTPFVGDADEIGLYIDHLTLRFDPVNALLTPVIARRIRRELLAEGYDGLVVYDGGGDGVDYVIALVEGIVRVVTER